MKNPNHFDEKGKISPKSSLRLKFLAGILLFFIIWILLSWLVAQHLIVEKKLEHADAILVLAGSSVYLERTDKAAEEFNQGVTAKIVLTDDGEQTGWSRTEQRNIPYVEMAKRNLVAQGVPAKNIEIIEPSGSGTIYEAQIFREKAERENWNKILLVTSAYHTRRTFWTFAHVFESRNVEFGIVSPPVGRQMPSPSSWWLSPRGWNLVAGEYVKGFYYWIYY